MRIDVPLFKIVQRPLLPVAGSWVDAAPFVIFFAILVFASFALRLKNPRTVQFLRRCTQLLSSFVFIFFLHRCLCMLRGWVFALRNIGRNDVIAFGHLCMFVLLGALTLSAGRLFCGWACPLGFFEELLGTANARRSRLARRTRLIGGGLVLGGATLVLVWMAYLVRPGTQFLSENVAALWGAALLVALVPALLLEPKDRKIKHLRYVSMSLWLLLSIVGVFVTSPWCTLFGDEVDYSSMVALIGVLLAALVIPMAWCRYICPMGAALALMAKGSPVKLTNRKACSHCGDCRHACPMGALDDGEIDHSSCIYCGRCVGTCGFAWESAADAVPAPAEAGALDAPAPEEAPRVPGAGAPAPAAVRAQEGTR